MKNDCFVCGDKYKERGEKLELAHMLSVDLARIIVLAQFNGGVKLKGDDEHVAFNKIIAKTRDKRKGDVYLCHTHHMYSDKQQRHMVLLLRTGLKTSKRFTKSHHVSLDNDIASDIADKSISFCNDDTIKKQEIVIEYLESRIRNLEIGPKETEGIEGKTRDAAKEKGLEKKYGGRPY